MVAEIIKQKMDELPSVGCLFEKVTYKFHKDLVHKFRVVSDGRKYKILFLKIKRDKMFTEDDLEITASSTNIIINCMQVNGKTLKVTSSESIDISLVNEGTVKVRSIGYKPVKITISVQKSLTENVTKILNINEIDIYLRPRGQKGLITFRVIKK